VRNESRTSTRPSGAFEGDVEDGEGMSCVAAMFDSVDVLEGAPAQDATRTALNRVRAFRSMAHLGVAPLRVEVTVRER
jgi:hypothetical protein